jgi:hypothetical protein
VTGRQNANQAITVREGGGVVETTPLSRQAGGGSSGR